MIDVYGIQLLASEEFELIRGQLLGHLPPEARERFIHLSRGTDVQRSLFGELLARYLIAGRLNISSKEIVFETGLNGKPALPDNDNLHFNISHSGKWVVCAISQVPVGVDVEHIRSVRPGLAERFFTNSEFTALQSLSNEERTIKFIELWTLKESFLKAIGRGLTRNLNSFSVVPHKKQFIISGNDLSGDYYLKLFEIDPAYKLSVCAPLNDFCEDVRKIEVDLLLHGL